ncbi:MAG: succinate--CoA ligase subunit alpha [Thermodesulfobacteriota bacterium]
MAILIDNNTQVIVQGITGYQGSLHTALSLEYGTKIIGGVVPGKGGEKVHGVSVFDSVSQILKSERVDATLILVPPPVVKEAALEAIENKIPLIVIITEHVPVHDTLQICQQAQAWGVHVIGPNTIGVISPGKCKVGVMPGFLYQEGPIGIVSRSGTLTHEVASNLTSLGIGQSTCVGIGGDAVIGTNFVKILELFRHDGQTKAIVLIGEIGGQMEEEAAVYFQESNFPKPLFAFIAGQSAPPGKRMGHAGAILEKNTRHAQQKMEFLTHQGIKVAQGVEEINNLIAQAKAEGLLD